MAYDYGFGLLENELIGLFDSVSPNFTKAEELIMKGANINALRKDREENVLSTLINEFLLSFPYIYSNYDGCNDTEVPNSIIGSTLCRIIQFFLSHGFDVNGYDGCSGAQCLYALVLSTFDRYMIEASKILFAAGAKNRTISDNADEDETPWDFVGSEASFQDTCENNHALGNLYEALYQVYKAVDEGKPYKGIDSYECAIGKKIIKVLASPNDKPCIFNSMDSPNFKEDKCFTSNLYFLYDGGVLQTTQFADFWVDTVLPENECIDVSEHFPNVIGSSIKSFSFSTRVVHKESTTYTQPITEIEMESGQCIKFSTNFGDVEDNDRAAFFRLKTKNK